MRAFDVLLFCAEIDPQQVHDGDTIFVSSGHLSFVEEERTVGCQGVACGIQPRINWIILSKAWRARSHEWHCDYGKGRINTTFH